VWLAAGLLGAFLTAYYTFRLIFIILFPKESGTESQSGHDHGGYWVMSWPLIVLAAITVILGFYQGALETFFNGQQGIPPAHIGHHAWLPFVAIGSALCGVGLAWLEFGRQGADQVGFVEKIAPLNHLFAERWYLDRFYRRFMDIFIYGVVSNLFTRNDKKVIDGAIDGLGKATVETGRFVSFLHLGMVQYRLLTIFVVLVFLGLYFFL
jgi:NADH-quinone oxidoreductase subunit L